ncbi:MAG: NAD-dependent epimerase/dehydratase family protein [Gemmatimonadota bacterium]|nr:NAD-dependent epimerase/dehydratase family protein [Gemmatimonadota bacterium]
MTTNRREFLKTSALVTGALSAGVGPASLGAQPQTRDETSSATSAPKPLRILILGGTGFIGPHEVRYAMQRGHKVTLFNRGKTNPGLFPDVEKFEGDRAVGNYASLKGHEWDVAIDNPTTIPRWVRQAGEALKGHAKQYVFISTISVYAKSDQPGADESAALETTTEPESEEARKYYGALKALSEKEAEKAFPGHTTVIRPGLIVGPGDLTDRFTYWPARIDKGGEVLAPGDPTDAVQIIDARDLAEWTIRVCEENTYGIYNATGPRSPLTISEMLGGIRAVTTSDAFLTWVDAPFLEEQKVRPWSDMPVWIPGRGGEFVGFARRNINKALVKGLTFRPLAVTAKDTLDFYNSEPEDRKVKLRAGLAPEREKEVLALWHAKKKA